MTMEDSAVDAAARHLNGLLSAGRVGVRLAPLCRPEQPFDAWRIQRRVSALRQRPVTGWKCGLPATDRWVVAALHDAVPSGSKVKAPPGPSGEGRIEPELAFELRHDLPPREQAYGAAEVFAAIGSVRLAVEVLGCRYEDASQASGPELMADGLWHQALVLGPSIIDLPAEPAFTLTVAVDGSATYTLAARHPDGDPRRALVWLAEFLRQQGHGLVAGQVVITGSLAGVIGLPFGHRCVLRYQGFGEMAITLVPF